MKKQKLIAAVLITVLSCLLLAGCKGEGDSTKNSTPSNSKTESASEDAKTSGDTGQVTIKASVWDLDTSSASAKTMADTFMARNPDIKVDLIDIPSSEYTNKLSIMLNGNNDLDVFWIKDGDTIKAIESKGQLADLSSFINRQGLDLNVFNGLADSFTTDDGKVFALPVNSSFYVLFYNKDLFDAAGVAYPGNDMTWSDFENLASKLTSGEGADKKYGALLHTWQACVQNWAIQDGKHTILDSDYSFMKDSYEMALRMQNAGTIMDYATLKTGNIHYSSPFLQGNIAMMPMGTWFCSTLIDKIKAGESTVNWGMAVLPHPEGVEAGWTVGSVTPIAINASSKKQEAAWKFVDFVTSEEGALIQAQAGLVPSRISTDSMSFVAEAEGMPDNALEILTAVKKITLDRPIEEKTAEVNQMLGEVHSLIMLGEYSIDQGLAEMSERNKEIQGQ
ncbi:ABC transporter substrate-binding protein [Anaerocolumna xylanovorans]|uniref:Carbohydrate ABC transporter substrate-binding protein, CUT1 family n=1 Tax=Anaerocolumna xylanovorans DSM 12503 TaxID=1121345 RepID=A0A1M7YHM5_9FIRM|nr:sugar ABC transporter substrate-binding protein [Anaerocolumna xylanovorans]SHO52130.1 carbohydrate ABC transporter substrate-binding protein, CUT1 family [Anaerocolumna xylanovorans DSM 12503]